MHAFSDFNRVESWERGNADDPDNQVAHVGTPEEPLRGPTEEGTWRPPQREWGYPVCQ